MTADILAQIRDVVGPKGYCDDPTDIAPHLTEWRGKYKGQSGLLLKPSSTEQVSKVMALCTKGHIAVVPQGGNTGLVGGQIPFHGEVILSTERLNKIRAVDIKGQSIIVEAGVPLAVVQKAAADEGLLFPLSLASEGSCTIGGNLSTNAGGVSVLRYGMTRDLTLGLEVVLADGRVLNLLRTLRKDNTGYDLKQVFVGAEGTLGIITAAALKLFPAPTDRVTALAAVPDIHAAINLLTHLQAKTGGLISAFELIPAIAMDLVTAYIPETRNPLRTPSHWYVLAEATSGHPIRSLFEEALAAAIGQNEASDAVVAESEKQRADLWRLREGISEAQKREGASIKHDISLPISAIPEFVPRATNAVLHLAPGARPVTFGHLGDGNLHFNFQASKSGDPAAFLDRWEEIQDAVHEIVHACGGSISAEHGIGVQKREALLRYKSPAEIATMRALKAALDPSGILNPGKILS